MSITCLCSTSVVRALLIVGMKYRIMQGSTGNMTDQRRLKLISDLVLPFCFLLLPLHFELFLFIFCALHFV